MHTTTPRSARAYAMVLCLLILTMLSASIGIVFLYLGSSQKVTARLRYHAETSAACTSVANVFNKLAAEFVSVTPSDSQNGANLNTFLHGRLGGDRMPIAIPPGFSLENGNVTFQRGESPRTVDRGPFAGLSAYLHTATMDITLMRDASQSRCQVTQGTEVAQFGLAQLSLFSANDLKIYPTFPFTPPGRVQVNGDLCLSGPAATQERYSNEYVSRLERTFAGGRMYDGRDEACGGPNNTLIDRAPLLCAPSARQLAIDPQHMDFREITALLTELYVPDNNDLRTCAALGQINYKLGGDTISKSVSDGNSASWTRFAMQMWGGTVADGALGVPQLRLPVQQMRGTGGVGHHPHNPDYAANKDNLRWIVEPPSVNDTSDVRFYRLAMRADLRIINGIWFVKGRSDDECMRSFSNDPDCWPGRPIWSDHPGHYDVGATAYKYEHEVLGGRPLEIPRTLAGEAPPRFSYYAFGVDNDGAVVFKPFDMVKQRGIISVGSLFRAVHPDGSPIWVPGYWPRAEFCPHNFGQFQNAMQDTGCGVSQGAAFTMAARTGFWDPVVARGRHLLEQFADEIEHGNGKTEFLSHVTEMPLSNRLHGNVLPINLDLGALDEEVSGTHSGSVGQRIRDHLRGREFNGVIYVGSLWPGAVHTEGSATAVRANAFQPGSKRAVPLPYQLCSQQSTSGSLTAPAHVKIAVNGDVLISAVAQEGTGEGVEFPFCHVHEDPHNPPTPGMEYPSFPNALRIINARRFPETGGGGSSSLSGLTLSRAYTIATNLPVYVLGTFAGNRNEPSLIAGDSVTLLSNAWNDRDMAFVTGDGATEVRPDQPATSTVYDVSFLTGLFRTHGGLLGELGAERVFRFPENWVPDSTEEKPIVTGSILIGWHPVYSAWPSCYDDTCHTTRPFFWLRTRKLDHPDFQPPGVPTLSVVANGITQTSR